jgi:hypothetical protein
VSIITKVLKQTAVYWPQSSFDEYGDPSFETPSEISCRWEDKMEEVVSPDGDMIASRAQVMVSSDVETGGFLLLASLEDIDEELSPKENDAFEIRSFSKLPNLRATEFLRIAYL